MDRALGYGPRGREFDSYLAYEHNTKKGNEMRNLFGILLMIAGLILGIWLGVWVCFIGGIVTIIGSLSGVVPFAALTIAFAILKICLASFIGWVSFMVLYMSGLAMLK